jgi:hypothetical protein
MARHNAELVSKLIVDAPSSDQVSKKLEQLREKSKLNLKQPKLQSTNKFKADLECFKSQLCVLQDFTSKGQY